MEHPYPNQSTKRRTKGEGAGCFFFFPGVAFVLDFLKLFCVIYLSLFVLFVLARTGRRIQGKSVTRPGFMC